MCPNAIFTGADFSVVGKPHGKRRFRKTMVLPVMS